MSDKGRIRMNFGILSPNALKQYNSGERIQNFQQRHMRSSYDTDCFINLGWRCIIVTKITPLTSKRKLVDKKTDENP